MILLGKWQPQSTQTCKMQVSLRLVVLHSYTFETKHRKNKKRRWLEYTPGRNAIKKAAWQFRVTSFYLSDPQEGLQLQDKTLRTKISTMAILQACLWKVNHVRHLAGFMRCTFCTRKCPSGGSIVSQGNAFLWAEMEYTFADTQLHTFKCKGHNVQKRPLIVCAQLEGLSCRHPWASARLAPKPFKGPIWRLQRHGIKSASEMFLMVQPSFFCRPEKELGHWFHIEY